ncbi:MAG: hypothetical protein LBD11_07380 [Candidatus Peribacteria bacterium]|nr:hypothetical protein [Candidatus Peribacteria bacterium]
MALVLRAITKQAEVAIIFAMMSDFSAAIPTLKKSYQHPETENISGFLP